MHRLNGITRYAVVAMSAAMLAGAGLTILAQADATGAQVPPAVQTPVVQTPAAQTPATQTPATPAIAVAAQGGIIKGTAKASGVPLPGVSVTATHSLTGKKFATTTDIDGSFQMAVPRNGRYVVKTELTGFATTTQEVLVNAASENGGLPTQTAEFKMDLASRVSATTVATGTNGAGASGRIATAGTVARVGRGTQSLAMQGGTDSDLTDASAGQTSSDTQLPSLAQSTSNDASNTESIAVSGQQGQTNGLAGFSEDDLRNRIQDMMRNGFANGDIASTLSGVMQTGSFGAGPGGGGPGGPGGGGPGGGFGPGGGGFGGGFGGFGGGFRGQNPNAWHGSFAYTGANSALNATSRSFTGTSIDKPQSDRNTLIASFTGTPYIPGWIKANSKQNVFLSVQETRNSNPSSVQIIVPTAAQRLGDLTPAYQAGKATSLIYQPNSTSTFGNSGCDPNILNYDPNPTMCIPSKQISSAAQALMKLYPQPNITPNSVGDNYQENFPGSSHSSQISARYNRSFGSTPVRGPRGSGGTRQSRNAKPTLRQSIAESFSYSHSASSSESFSSLLSGASVSNQYSFSSSYTVGYGRINSTTSVGWNRSRSKTTNASTNGTSNPAVDDGILVGDSSIYTNPFYYGIPSINMSGQTGVAGLSDTAPNDTINQTISISEMVSYSHHKHNMRYGFDFRRIHADTIGGSNVLGSFTFSGAVTQYPTLATCVQNVDPTNPTCAAGGSAVADFLLGLPKQTAITASSNKIYLRGNSWDWFAQDDWRARSNLTFNFGLRWEYFSPYEEKNGHLVNIEMTGSGSSLGVENVCGTGCTLTTGQFGTPKSLVNPDKALYSPRVAVAWSPKYKWTKQTVVRSGYGINYNTGQYSRFASTLALQQPFAVTQTNTLNSSGCTSSNMTLSSGFGCTNSTTTQSNYGVNPNYRIGMVQSYNLGIQRTLPQGVVLNIDYTGAYAGNLDIVRVPNRDASGTLNLKSTQFNYEDSLGYQRSNALTISARERMHKGVSLQAAYKYAHSIDDASSIGGSGSYTAQDDTRLGAEQSNSSFDRRHTLSINFTLEPPFGPNRAFLNKGGIWAKILDGYSINGTFISATGSFASPQFTGTDAEVTAGANYLRPNRNPGQSIKGAGTQAAWFNPSAFVGACTTNPLPYCLPDKTYGTAGRNSIEMPGTLTLNGSLSRTVNLGGTRSFEARITANNAFNTVQYAGVNTTINSSTPFGEVTSAAAMRSFNYSARFRF